MNSVYKSNLWSNLNLKVIKVLFIKTHRSYPLHYKFDDHITPFDFYTGLYKHWIYYYSPLSTFNPFIYLLVSKTRQYVYAIYTVFPDIRFLISFSFVNISNRWFTIDCSLWISDSMKFDILCQNIFRTFNTKNSITTLNRLHIYVHDQTTSSSFFF